MRLSTSKKVEQVKINQKKCDSLGWPLFKLFVNKKQYNQNVIFRVQPIIQTTT